MALRGHKKIKLHLSVSKLQRMSKKDLRELENMRFIVSKNHETLAVLIPYGHYLDIKNERKKLQKEVDRLENFTNSFD